MVLFRKHPLGITGMNSFLNIRLTLSELCGQVVVKKVQELTIGTVPYKQGLLFLWIIGDKN